MRILTALKRRLPFAPDKRPSVEPDGPATTGSFAPDAGGDAPTHADAAPPVAPADATTTMHPRRGDASDPSITSTGTPEAGTSASGPLTVGQSFGVRYRILRLLGVGGMGAVYQAWDAELGVEVALKVVRPDSKDPEGTHESERRFKRELLLARQVTHPNVVRIHDLGDVDGVKFITMSYVEGADLSRTLKREGHLPPARALRIASQMAAGLVAAHKVGVVHRDLKPSNIMINAEGEALIMDFGIARAMGVPADQKTGRRHRMAAGAFSDTIFGAVVGTLHYMAPEQARGDPVDHRADIYAFGLILRDMLVGLDRRMGAPTALAELQRRLDEAPPSLRSIDSAIPEPLDHIVSRCLAPDAAERYQTAADLEADLNRLDENGEPIPIRRVVGLPLAVAVVTFLLALSGGAWWYARTLIPPAPHEPVSVVIADFQNSTNDPAFDGTLEPMLKRALEGAGFISAYDRNGIRSALGVQPPAKLDEVAARGLAAKQGLGVVLSGSIDRQGNGYAVSVKAVQTLTGKVIASAQSKASNKDQVLGVATKLVTTVRKALGDKTSDSAQMFAMASVSATSLEVVRQYAAAREAASNGKLDEAQRSFGKAVELDPKFGIGYQALAGVSMNLGNLQDADKYIKEALHYLDWMTERERFTTRGLSYTMTGDYQQCVKEYSDMIARYAADVMAHNNLALCSTYLRNMPKALSEMRRAVEILPKRALYRFNLALYANYAGDFQTGGREAITVRELGSAQWSLFALALAQLGQEQLPQAAASYQELAKIDALSASQAASGLGDLATYEGRFSNAVRILEQGAAVDLMAKNGDRAAAKFAALAYAELLRGQKRAAIAAAEKALTNGKALKIRFLTARIFIEAGEMPNARTLIAGLASEQTSAYAKILEGDVALKTGDAPRAIKFLIDANTSLDTWIGHFDLGRAYLEAGAFVPADSEFDRCIKRRGEALALFLDEEPTYAYFPLVYYYQGRAREGLNTAGFAESYRAYLNIRSKSTEDPLLPEVRRRAGS